MATLNVYEQYFEAQCIFNGVERHAVNVMLISNSEAGEITYELAISFFPHTTPDDFCIPYDAYFSKILYQAKGRRSKKREAELLRDLQTEANALAMEHHASIDWEHPLIEARIG
ncbi:MAG: hypothetical protein J6A01_12640 [Proteobacteria bacterium]|nr:hypothetical protein [Pseudomonadota bacterium]